MGLRDWQRKGKGSENNPFLLPFTNGTGSSKKKRPQDKTSSFQTYYGHSAIISWWPFCLLQVWELGEPEKKRCWTIWPFSLIQQSFSYDCYSALGLSSEPSSLGVPCILRHNLFFSLKLWAPLTQVNITMYNQTRLGITHFNLKEVSFCWYKCDIKLLPFFWQA